MASQVFSQNLLLERICSNLSIEEANNLRRACRRLCFNFSFPCNDLDKQIKSIPFLNSKTYSLVMKIQKIGSVHLSFKLIRKGEIVQLERLLKWGFNPNHQYKNKETILCIAAELEMVKLLVKYGAVIDHSENDSALFWTIQDDHFDIFEYFVQQGANLTRYVDGETVFTRAIRSGSLRIVKYLIELGFDIDVRNNVNESALMIASDYNHPDIVLFLCEQGANVNFVGKNGNTAFIYAVHNDNLKVARILHKFGANMEIINNSRLSAIDYAIDRFNVSECLKWLHEIGYDLRPIYEKEKAQQNILRMTTLEYIIGIKTD